MENNTKIKDKDLSNVVGGSDTDTSTVNNIRKGATYKKKSSGQFAKLGYEFYARVRVLKANQVGCDYGTKYPDSNTIAVKSYLSDTIDCFIDSFDITHEINDVFWND